jgi:hypothetical protein
MKFERSSSFFDIRWSSSGFKSAQSLLISSPFQY